MLNKTGLPDLDFKEGELRWWVKIVGFLQQNWAIIRSDGVTIVLFANDLGGIFDWIEFSDEWSAQRALTRNGFSEFDKDLALREFLMPPEKVIGFRSHPDGPIYSSGRFWKS